VYFFVIKKKKEEAVTGINKEWIIGKWKTATPKNTADLAKSSFDYDFQKEGIALCSIVDTLPVDTLHYTWKDTGGLLLREKATDTTGIVLAISRLTQDSLEVKGDDNKIILFTRVK
jgi:hypothetical protein